jgi:hypothetical protein
MSPRFRQRLLFFGCRALARKVQGLHRTGGEAVPAERAALRGAEYRMLAVPRHLEGEEPLRAGRDAAPATTAASHLNPGMTLMLQRHCPPPTGPSNCARGIRLGNSKGTVKRKHGEYLMYLDRCLSVPCLIRLSSLSMHYWCGRSQAASAADSNPSNNRNETGRFP